MSSGEPATGTTRDPLIGQLVGGRYRVHGVIGTGGMGIVYDAIHEELGRGVALKVLSAAWASDEGAIKRFQREARTSSNIGHDNIVDVYDLGRLEDGRPFLAMERLHGESLADLLDRQGRVAADRVARLMLDAASALDAVHAKGIMHRDIKPENLVVVGLEDGRETVKLLDFGLAAFAIPSPENARLTRQGQVHGTPHYMAPEAGGAELPDKRADVYSLAVVAYELLCGEVPFDSPNPLHILTQKMQDAAPSMGDRSGIPFPATVERVLAKGLAREPEDRHQSAGDFARELGDAIGRMSGRAQAAVSAAPTRERAHADATETRTSGVVGPELEPPAPQAALPQRRPLWPWALALVLFVGAAGGSWYLLREPGAISPARADESAGEPTAAGEPAAAAARQPDAPAEPDEPDEPAASEGRGERAAREEQAAGADSEATAAQQGEQAEEPEPERRARRRRAVRRTAAASSAGATEDPQEPDETADEKASGDGEPQAREEAEPPELAGSSRARAKALADQATTALVRGRLPDAIRHFRDATNADSRFAPAWRGLGLANERLGRKPEAIRAYERYLRLAPGAADAASVRDRIEKLKSG